MDDLHGIVTPCGQEIWTKIKDYENRWKLADKFLNKFSLGRVHRRLSILEKWKESLVNILTEIKQKSQQAHPNNAINKEGEKENKGRKNKLGK